MPDSKWRRFLSSGRAFCTGRFVNWSFFSKFFISFFDIHMHCCNLIQESKKGHINFLRDEMNVWRERERKWEFSILHKTTTRWSTMAKKFFLLFTFNLYTALCRCLRLFASVWSKISTFQIRILVYKSTTTSLPGSILCVMIFKWGIE